MTATFQRWLQRAALDTWLIENKRGVAALQKAYEAGQRNGRRTHNKEKKK